MDVNRRQLLLGAGAGGVVCLVAGWESHPGASAAAEIRSGSPRSGGLAAKGKTSRTAKAKTTASARPKSAAGAVSGVPPQVRTAVNFATAVVLRRTPYVYGAVGPDAFDCSGLVQAAYAKAGVYLPRTSEEQWAFGARVRSARVGDLVFFAGGDGTWAAPGHVALVVGVHWVIQAYEAGYDVMRSTYGLSSSLPGVAAGEVVGYTRPVPSR